MKHLEVKKQLKETYDRQYKNNSKLDAWRALGGKEKALRIKELAEKTTYKKVLEYGAGEGSILQELNGYDNFKNLYAVELSLSGKDKVEARKLNKLVEVQVFDGYKTSYPDNHFDLVYCSHVIEHVEFPRMVLREIKRISKSHIFEIPLDYDINIENRVDYFLDYGHINIYTPSLFKFLLKSEGFTIEKEVYSNTKIETIRFNWYRNRGIKKSFFTEFKLRSLSLYLIVKRLVMGQRKFNEYHRNAYSCRTTKLDESLKIF